MIHKTLVILAAGIGSRFGRGVKQLTSFDDNGHLIIDYSIHDAIVAGFSSIIFIIRRNLETEFRSAIGDRIESICKPLGIDISYAYQELTDIPEFPGKEKAKKRTKPWGTGHAVLSCDSLIDGPFAVINSDDYYGKNSFIKAAEFLDKHPSDYALLGYKLKNTLSDNGGVTRGICLFDDGKLTGIAETRNIIKSGKSAEANGREIDMESLVSMNFWCYPKDFIKVLRDGFPEFLENMTDPLKDEYLLPIIADGMIRKGTEFTVLPTDDRWFGVTYKEDEAAVREAIRRLINSGEYREDLYSDLLK